MTIEKDLGYKGRLEELFEKYNGVWKCKVCNKSANRERDIKEHAETHIKCVVHSCSICMKNFSTSHSLRTHVNTFHSKLYFCPHCHLEDMNRKIVKEHNKGCHCIPEEQ